MEWNVATGFGGWEIWIADLTKEAAIHNQRDNG